MNAIKVKNLTKRYGDFTAVDHVSFEVKKGTMLGFLGINGAGKSTVINMLATLLSPEEGSAEVCGHQLGKENMQIRKKIGIVYQQNCLDDCLSVQENLICRGILHGISKKEAFKKEKELSEILKLDDILGKRYQTLSGGQKRRCEIAAALMHTPEILFLDEPTTGLDPATRVDVWNTIEALQKNEKMTVFLTTHYMEEAAKADQIIILDHGNIMTAGTPYELKEKYASDRLYLYYKDGRKEEMVVKKSMDALGVVNEKESMLEGFEVIQGNMDDVFLNATGKRL